MFLFHRLLLQFYTRISIHMRSYNGHRIIIKYNWIIYYAIGMIWCDIMETFNEFVMKNCKFSEWNQANRRWNSSVSITFAHVCHAKATYILWLSIDSLTIEYITINNKQWKCKKWKKTLGKKGERNFTKINGLSARKLIRVYQI